MLARYASLFFVFVFILSIAPLANATPQTTDGTGNETPASQLDPKLAELRQAAQQAEIDNDFKSAAQQWKQVWEQFPKSEFAGLARLRAGNCYLKLQQYPLAIESLQAAIPLLTTTDKKTELAKARLLLGYSQLELGKQIAAKQDAGSKKQANSLFATATRSFEQLLRKNSNDAHAEQACFFLGSAYALLDRKQDAINAYKKMDNVQNKQGTFRFDSLYAIAVLHHQLGQYGQANKYFDLFLAESKQTGHPDRDAVQFSASQTLIALGEAAKANGDAAAMKNYFSQAIDRLKKINDQPAKDNRPQFATLIRDSKQQMALCHRQLDQFQQAADLFADLSSDSVAPDTTIMKTFAGLSYMDAGQTEKAIDYLEQATSTVSKSAVEAARWLADHHLKQQAYQEAYDLATRFVPIAEPPHLVPLKILQAEATTQLPARQADTIELFQNIVDDHAEDSLAPLALYKLALAQAKQQRHQAAITTTQTFLDKFPRHDYATNVLELQADALMLAKNYTDAEKAYTRLISESAEQNDPELLPNKSKRLSWALSIANAKFLQQNFAGAISTASSALDQINDPGQQSEALQLIGKSHYQIQAYAKAAENLAAALDADPTSTSNDDSRFFLALSQLKLKEFEKASQTIAALAAKSPSSPRLNQAYIQLGNHQYDADEQADAISFFQKVIDAADAKPTDKAEALFGAAWANLKNNNPESAEKLFSQVIDQYPDSKLVETAKEGRSDARRLTGKSESSIADLESLAAKSEGKKKIDLLMDLGLKQVTEKNWQAAITTFEQLVKSAPEDDRLDRFYYELAWAYRSIEQEATAMEFFAKIAKQKPNSDFAAEANFHLGKKAYDSKRWGEAIAAFQACLDRADAKPNVREKAAYKLAWAFYKQDKFSESHAAFKKQIEMFPDGPLLADGKFMVAESLFREKKFGDAFAAYKVAKPVIQASSVAGENLQWLTMLHGTQAANKANDYLAAIELAKGIEDSEADAAVKQDIYLELGKAYNELKNDQLAKKYWTMAAESLGATGARAMCMLGNQLFTEKQHEEAITQYKMVFFGFGGKQAKTNVRPWQAYARYQAARCNFVRVASAKEVDTKRQLVQQAREHFEKLIQDYPNDRLAPEAKRQIEVLDKIRF